MSSLLVHSMAMLGILGVPGTPNYPTTLTLPEILPLVFLVLMGLSMLVYVVLDGYDLGVGILFGFATPAEQDKMMASIGPFWDANETWLVLGVGLLLTAFPVAHGLVLTHLYLPVALMLLGLILRGVAFDFRSKAALEQKVLWSRVFQAGALIATLAQGYMLGRYITGFKPGWLSTLFAACVGVALVFGYVLMGSTWVLMKCNDHLQVKATRWARAGLVGAALGVAVISVATPLASSTISARWFSFPLILFLCPIPLLTLTLFWRLHRSLTPQALGSSTRRPFLLSVGILTLAFTGLAVSILPFVVVDSLTVWEAAASYEALTAIAWGAVIVLPAIIAYTCFVYWLFRGKTDDVAYP